MFYGRKQKSVVIFWAFVCYIAEAYYYTVSINAQYDSHIKIKKKKKKKKKKNVKIM